MTQMVSITRTQPTIQTSSRRSPTTDSSKRIRSGSVVLEFIVAFPLIIIASLAIFQFSFLMLVHQAGTTAAIEGTRLASTLPQTGGLPFDNNAISDSDPDDNNDIADRAALRVEQFLAIHKLEVEPPGSGDNDPNRLDARVIVQRRLANGLVETASRGNNSLTCELPVAELNLGEVRVVVCFPVVDPQQPTATSNPVPNWLSPFGISELGRDFRATSRALFE